ncbi:MAG TPA: hypothetical protein VGH21_07675, partial [Solirubrobacteraceae bacterium]
RYEDERAMLVTTNLESDELREQLGERTVSRLTGICGNGLHLYGADDRLQHPLTERLLRAQQGGLKTETGDKQRSESAGNDPQADWTATFHSS